MTTRTVNTAGAAVKRNGPQPVLKASRPTSAGVRHKVARLGVTSGYQGVPKALSRGAKEQGGRNNTGRITCFHRGGGVKTAYRLVTSMIGPSVGVVAGIQWDPGRSSPVALVHTEVVSASDQTQRATQRYRVAGEGMAVGDVLICDAAMSNYLPNHRTLRGNVPVGMTVYDISENGSRHGTLVKTPGASAVVQRHDVDEGRTRVRMPSGEVRWRKSSGWATIGAVGAKDHRLEVIGKAGVNRRRGIRPTVRGCAMNPVDHPHGGRTKGGRHDVTPWAKIAKGQPTRRKTKPLVWVVKTSRQARRERKATRV